MVDKTWYKDLEDPDTFYTKVASFKLLDGLTEFCAGLHTVYAVDIPQLMKKLYKDRRECHNSLMQWRQRSVS